MRYVYIIFFILFGFKGFSQGTDAIIFIDNSGSILQADFDTIKSSATKLMNKIVNCNSENKVSIIQYNTALFIESPFTNSIVNFSKRAPDGGEIHQKFAAVSQILNSGYSPLTSLQSPYSSLTRTPGNNLVIYIFTNALRNYDLLQNANATSGADPGFEPYTYFKTHFGAKIVMINPIDHSNTRRTCAGIASSGGNYYGDMEIYQDPDNGISPRLFINTFSLTSESINIITEFVCPEYDCTSLTLNIKDYTSYLYNNKSDITVQTNYVLDPGDNINMRAENFIVLKPNTHIKANALFHAKIEECPGGTVISPRPVTTSVEDTARPASVNTIASVFSIYPNPASSNLNIVSTSGIQSVLVTSLDGKVMLNRSYADVPSTADLDISSYAQGYYLVSITTKTGEVHTQKLIKN